MTAPGVVADAATTLADVPEFAAQTRGRSLASNLFWTLGGNAVYSLCQWGMLIGIIRIGQPALAGAYSLGLAITAPIFMLTNMQLANVLATDGGNQFSFRTYTTLRWTASSLAFTAALVIAFAIPAYRGASAIVALIALAKVIESGSDLVYGLMQRWHRMDRVAIGLMARGALALIVLLFTLRASASLPAAIAMMALAYAVVYLAYDRRGIAIHQHDAPINAHDAPTKALARLAIPLGFAAMLTSINVTLPRLFIEQSHGLAVLGVFSALAYLIVAGRLVALPFALAFSPRLADAIARGNVAHFRRLFGYLIAAGVALGLLGVAAAVILGAWGLRVLYGPEYSRYVSALTLLMVAAALGYLATYLQYVLTVARIIRAQTIVIAASALVLAVALWRLVPAGGIAGAAQAMVLGALAEFAGSAILVASMFRGQRSRQVA